jgi:hypothetical protein
MICSLSKITFDSSFVFFETDPEIGCDDMELSKFVSRQIPGVCVKAERLISLGQWKDFLLEQKIIEQEKNLFYLGNDDHIFIDSNTDCLEQCIIVMESLLKLHDYVSCTYSHYFEYNSRWNDLLYNDKYVTAHFYQEGHDSIQILSPLLVKRWFFEETDGLPDGFIIRRAEDIPHRLPLIHTLQVRPKKELFRHFDGYSHVGMQEYCPPLSIPDGFFDKNLKLFECSVSALSKDELREIIELKEMGWTILDPDSNYNSCIKVSGADLDRRLEEIPAFWSDSISEVRQRRTDAFPSRLSFPFQKLCNATYLSQGQILSIFAAESDHRLALGDNTLDCTNNSYKPLIPRKLWTHKVNIASGASIGIVFLHRTKFRQSLARNLKICEMFKSINPKLSISIFCINHSYDNDHLGYFPTQGAGGDPSFYPANHHISGIFSFVTSHLEPVNLLWYINEFLNKIDCKFVLFLEQSFCTSEWSILPIIASLAKDLNRVGSTDLITFYRSNLLINGCSVLAGPSAILSDKAALDLILKYSRQKPYQGLSTSSVELMWQLLINSSLGRFISFSDSRQEYSGRLLAAHGFGLLSNADLFLKS